MCHLFFYAVLTYCALPITVTVRSRNKNEHVFSVYCDTASIMSYGMAWAGSAPGPVSPRSWLEGIYDYASEVMDTEKVFLGMPAYGWNWQIYDLPSNIGKTYRGTSQTYYAAQNWLKGVYNFTDDQPPQPFIPCSLSGNTWSGSNWDGTSKYTKQTKEQNTDGSYTTITADFRNYPCVEDSIADHSAYLLGAKNGSKLRYDGLKGCTDYKKAAQIIKDGGYATSLTYVQNLCSIIERWNLTQFDVKESETAVAWYRVRKTWADAKTQKGAYKILENAKKCADANPGYSVFDVNGVNIYTPNTTSDSAAAVPFFVKVSISDLNIRKGPGTDYARTQYIPVGVYTIVEVKSGKGSTAGWGRLKSGAGWISLDYTVRV